MLSIGIITGSTRANRVSPQVAQHILRHAEDRAGARYEIVDIAAYDLPLYDEPLPALFSADYQTPQTKAWSETINRLDGFVFITPEYNRGVTAAQKNAIDYLYNEFVNKAAGIVSYGSAGGRRRIGGTRPAGDSRHASGRHRPVPAELQSLHRLQGHAGIHACPCP